MRVLRPPLRIGTVPLRAHTRKLDLLRVRGMLELVQRKAKIAGFTLVFTKRLVFCKERLIAAKEKIII
jgi:hypothetical protein